MNDIILRPNAIPVYAFLSLINNRQSEKETFCGKKILDCGAGGILPPLTLFNQLGFDTWGLDNSDEQIIKANKFCDEHGISLKLCKGDMRQIPFENETFDYVFEHYSMCHLSKKDTAIAISEMYRVLKKGGLCFLGVISIDSWPKSNFGEEKEPGQFLSRENGNELRLHSMFTDEESDQLVSGWEIISKEKKVIYQRESARETSLDAWMDLYHEVQDMYTHEGWKEMYTKRIHRFQYTHLYYFLKKPNK